jgi:hypothetical protein
MNDLTEGKGIFIGMTKTKNPIKFINKEITLEENKEITLEEQYPSRNIVSW